MKVYHAHEWTCSFTKWVDRDYIVELLNDSTLDFTCYSSENQQNTISMLTFSGIYKKNADTLKICSLKYVDGRNNQETPQISQEHVNANLPLIFVATDTSLASTQGWFSIMKLSSPSVAAKLKLDAKNSPKK